MNKTWWKGRHSYKFKHKTWKSRTRTQNSSNGILLWKDENNKQSYVARSYPKLVWNKLEVTWKELTLFASCWRPIPKKIISKQLKISQANSRDFKIFHKILRYPKVIQEALKYFKLTNQNISKYLKEPS
jgi:hypothetical protein